MPKRKLEPTAGDEEVIYDGMSSTQAHHPRFRFHFPPDSGPLYVANFSTRTVIDTASLPKKGSLVEEPQVYVEKKPSRQQSLFARRKTNDGVHISKTMVNSVLTDSSGEYKTLEYNGTTDKLSAVEQHRRIFVAFVNKKSRKINIVPAASVFMRPTLERDAEEDTADAKVPDTFEAKKQSVQDLTFAFGSHKKQQALKSANERKSLATDAVNTAIETAMQEAKSAPQLAKVEGKEEPKTPIIESTSNGMEDFDIGTPNLGAISSSNVFPLDQIVPEEILHSLQPISREKESELPILIKRCLQGNSKPPSEKLLQILAYLKLLIEMYKARGAKLKKGDCVPRNLAPPIRNIILNRFLVILESTADSTSWGMPPRLRTRLLAHILLMAMHAYAESGCSFAVNVADLQTDLALAPRTLTSVARQFGCTLSAGAGGHQVISINIPYRPPAPPTGKGPRKGGR